MANYSASFYKNLYSSRYSKQKTSSFLDLVNYVKVISESDRIFFCDSIVTPEEVQRAIKSLKNNKSPGCDGLTDELYQLLLMNLLPF